MPKKEINRNEVTNLFMTIFRLKNEVSLFPSRVNQVLIGVGFFTVQYVCMYVCMYVYHDIQIQATLVNHRVRTSSKLSKR